MENELQAALAANAAASTTLYYGCVWSIAFLCGLSRTLRDGDFRSMRHCGSVGVFAGCLGATVVAVLDGHQHDIPDGSVFYLGVSALVGLSGKENALFIAFALRMIASKLGIDVDEELTEKNDATNDET